MLAVKHYTVFCKKKMQLLHLLKSQEIKKFPNYQILNYLWEKTISIFFVF